jgi:hypothetical protein
VSVIAGLEEHLVSGMMVSTAQSVAGLARSRHVRRDAYDALGRVRQIAAAFADSDERSHDGRGDIKTRRTELATRSRRLGAAESELSFGVRANGDIRLLLPVAEVADYHADLATVLDWDAGLATTERLLASLGQTLASARESLAAAERDRDEHFPESRRQGGCRAPPPGSRRRLLRSQHQGHPRARP